MRDFDFHRPEETVRTFAVPDDAIVHNDETTCISQTRQRETFADDGRELVLRHYAFADEWFKLNATFDLDGTLIQPGPQETAFAVSCDIATPMVRLGSDITALDLVPSVAPRTRPSW